MVLRMFRGSGGFFEQSVSVSGHKQQSNRCRRKKEQKGTKLLAAIAGFFFFCLCV